MVFRTPSCCGGFYLVYDSVLGDELGVLRLLDGLVTVGSTLALRGRRHRRHQHQAQHQTPHCHWLALHLRNNVRYNQICNGFIMF